MYLNLQWHMKLKTTKIYFSILKATEKLFDTNRILEIKNCHTQIATRYTYDTQPRPA